MLPSPVTSTPFSVKDILKLEQQHALNPNGFIGAEQDTVPLQSLQLQCMQSTLSRSLDLLYSPEKHSVIAGEQLKCALNSDDFDIVRSSCGSPTEEEETSRSFIVINTAVQSLQGEGFNFKSFALNTPSVFVTTKNVFLQTLNSKVPQPTFILFF